MHRKMYTLSGLGCPGASYPRIEVKPEIGKAVIFHNVDIDGHVLPKSMHGGMEITRGEKWIANKWIHRK
jgi:prolyl 4-hydroxylase